MPSTKETTNGWQVTGVIAARVVALRPIPNNGGSMPAAKPIGIKEGIDVSTVLMRIDMVMVGDKQMNAVHVPAAIRRGRARA